MKNLIYIIFLVFGLIVGGCISLISLISPIAVYIFLFLFSVLLTINLRKIKQNKIKGKELFRSFFITEGTVLLGMWTFVINLTTDIQLAVLIFNIVMFCVGIINVLKLNKE